MASIVTIAPLTSNAEDEHEHLSAHGASRSQHNQYPQLACNAHHSFQDQPSSSNEVNDEAQQNECSICMFPLSGPPNGQATYQGLRTLPCRHSFHEECIQRWLGQNTRCPLCRAVVDGNEGDARESRRTPSIERVTLDMESLLSSIRPELRRIYGRQLTCLLIVPALLVYNISTSSLVSTYPLFMVIFMNLISILLVKNMIEDPTSMTPLHLARTQEVFSNFPFVRVILIIIILSFMVVETKTVGTLGMIAVLSIGLQLFDELSLISIISPVIFHSRAARR